MIGLQKHYNPDIEKELGWMLSNLISTHSETILNYLISNPFYMELINHGIKMSNPSSACSKKEFLYGLRSLSFAYGPEIIKQFLLKANLLECFIDYLELNDTNHLGCLSIVLDILSLCFLKDQDSR